MLDDKWQARSRTRIAGEVNVTHARSCRPYPAARRAIRRDSRRPRRRARLSLKRRLRAIWPRWGSSDDQPDGTACDGRHGWQLGYCGVGESSDRQGVIVRQRPTVGHDLMQCSEVTEISDATQAELEDSIRRGTMRRSATVAIMLSRCSSVKPMVGRGVDLVARRSARRAIQRFPDRAFAAT